MLDFRDDFADREVRKARREVGQQALEGEPIDARQCRLFGRASAVRFASDHGSVRLAAK
ncbi:MAG: hypothetical protein ACREUE_09340 [Panacagrimonas sp.]